MTEDTIAVALRVRPIIKRENKLANTNVWDIVGNEISLNDASGVFVNREIFTFDYIFDQSATNKELFELVHPLVLSSIEGYNATVFAYGQTSSGKTHSILGTDTDPGIIPLAAHDIFNCIRERSQESEEIYTVRLSYVEIYNEKINDLLDLNNKDIKIRENNSGNVFIQCHEDIVGNEAAMIKTINIGSKNRQIGETRMNERSSRSHVICDITIESRERIENEEILEQNDYPVKVGHLYIVDLAGSERISQTRATGQRLNEGVHINKSLLNLIKVITQLSTGNIFISFRDSKLTRLLTNSLGGNCRTLIIATITPVSVDDSLSTLKFARRAKLIKNKPRVNEVNTSDSYIGKFYALQKKMNKVLAERNGAMEMLEDKDEVIKNLKKQLLPYSNMFVTSNDPERPPKPSRRRHTMGSLKADEKHMETICEQWEPSVSKEHENFKKQIVEILPENKFEKATSSTFDADQYQDLRMQYDQLDQSHAELKEFTKTQMNVEVEERTVELQKEVSRLTQLLSEREQYAADLDFSHATLREFTRLEEDIVVKERTRLLQLQEELSILKKRNLGQIVYIITELSLLFLPYQKLTPVIRELSWLSFTTLIWPTSIFITTVFWSLYKINRDWILPKYVEVSLPLHLNHSVHSLILVLHLVEFFLTKHQSMPNIQLMKALNFAYMLVYALVLNGTYIYDNVWIYPFFEWLSWPQRFVVYILTFVAVQFLLRVGYTLLGYRCRQNSTKLKH